MIKKFLFFVSLFVLLSPKTYADQTQTDYWGYDLTHFTTGQFNNCLNDTNCGDTIQTIPFWGYNTDLSLQYPGFMSSTINTVANSYGAMFNFNTNQTLTTDYYYSLQLFMCNMTNNINPTFLNLYGSTTWTNLESYNSKVSLKHSSNNITLADEPYPSYGTSSSGGTSEGANCRAFSVIFKPSTKTTILGLQFTTSSTTNANWWIVGYELDNLGFSNYLTNSDVQNIIDNSGFASAESVEEVQQSIENVKTEIKGMEDQQIQTNEKLDDLNDNITSTDSPDTSGLNDVAGWLPPGPVDSLINLPLSLFNSISRDLSTTCNPVTLPLPYINKNLTLPCMSTFYNGIGIGDFMDWVGVIASGFILFSYLMKLYKWVDDTLTFRENNHLDNWGGV